MTHISASQIEGFRLCPRKWGWRYLDGIEAPPHPSAVVGSRVHEIAEAWLRDGTQPDLEETIEYEHQGKTVVRHPGRIFHAGIHHNPPPAGPYRVEERIDFRTSAATWLGYVDLSYTDPMTGELVVQDHKTTSNIRYALEEEELRTNTQAVLYAAAMHLRYGVGEVRLDWVYYQTRPRGSRYPTKKVSVTVEPRSEQTTRVLKQIDETACVIGQVRQHVPSTLVLPAQPGACDAYGGCPYRDRCSDVGLWAERKGEDQMTEELEQVIAKHSAASPPPLPASPPPLPASPPPLPTSPPPLPTSPPPLPTPGAEDPSAVIDTLKAQGKTAEQIASATGISLIQVAQHMGEQLDWGRECAWFRTELAAGRTAEEIARHHGIPLEHVVHALSSVNPPEQPADPGAPPPVAETPEADKVTIPEGGPDAMDRASLKALAVERGWVKTSCRFGEERLRDLVKERLDIPQVTRFSEKGDQGPDLSTLTALSDRACDMASILSDMASILSDMADTLAAMESDDGAER